MNLVGFIRQFQTYLTVSTRWVSRFTDLVYTAGAEQINVTLHFFIRPSIDDIHLRRLVLLRDQRCLGEFPGRIFEGDDRLRKGTVSAVWADYAQARK